VIKSSNGVQSPRGKQVETPNESFIKFKAGQVKTDLCVLEAEVVVVLVLHSGSHGPMIEDDSEHALVHRRYARPSAIADIDEAKRGERPESLADDCAGHVQLGSEGGLARQGVARREALASDMCLQRLHDVLDEPASEPAADA